MKNTDKALEVLKTMVSISSVNMELFEYGLLDGVNEAINELEEAMKPKRCDGCWYGKTTINSVICGKNGTYKEADYYCKYYNPKEQ
jgi:hypothetical protein